MLATTLACHGNRPSDSDTDTAAPDTGPVEPIPDHLGSIGRIVADGHSWRLGVSLCAHDGTLAVGTDGDIGENPDDDGRHAGRVYGVRAPYEDWAAASDVAAFRLAGDSTYSEFGQSCAWTDEGLVIGAPARAVWGAAYWFSSSPSSDAGVDASSMAVVGDDGDASQGYFGHGVALIEADTDGTAELAVGQVNVDASAGLPGRVYFYQPAAGEVRIGTARAVLDGVSVSDRLGTRLVTGGDLDADGITDLLASASEDEQVAPRNGAVWLVTMPLPPGTLPVTDAASGGLLGEEGDAFAGWGVDFAGDLNADGYDDVVVGAPNAAPNGIGSGRAYVVLGPTSGITSLSSADAHLDGEGEADDLGYAVARLNDVNGDGVPDFAVGAPGDLRAANEPGRVYVVDGATARGAIEPSSTRLLQGRHDNDFFGAALTSVGDADGDGVPDFAVGAPNDDEAGPGGGKVYILPGADW